MSRLGRPRLPNYMTGPPGNVLRDLGIPRDQWTAAELLTAMAYRDAARIERETWGDCLATVDGLWSTHACMRWGDFYVGKAAFIVGVGCDPADDGVLRSLLDPARLSDHEGWFGRPVGE